MSDILNVVQLRSELQRLQSARDLRTSRRSCLVNAPAQHPLQAQILFHQYLPIDQDHDLILRPLGEERIPLAADDVPQIAQVVLNMIHEGIITAIRGQILESGMLDIETDQELDLAALQYLSRPTNLNHDREVPTGVGMAKLIVDRMQALSLSRLFQDNTHVETEVSVLIARELRLRRQIDSAVRHVLILRIVLNKTNLSRVMFRRLALLNSKQTCGKRNAH